MKRRLGRSGGIEIPYCAVLTHPFDVILPTVNSMFIETRTHWLASLHSLLDRS